MALNEKMKENIDRYSEQITTITDFVEAVRQMPGYHLGGIGDKGFLNMIREIVQNAIDQLISPLSPCNKVIVKYDERSLWVSVEDNGLGIPFNDMVRIFTKEHTSKNYTKQKGDYSSGLHGVGAKVTNALSDSFIVESYNYQGKAMRLEMVEGYPKKGHPIEISNKEKKQGTKIEFHPLLSVMGDINLSYEVVYNLFKRIMSLTPLGSTMEFVGITKNGKVHSETIVNTDGIITDLIMKTSKPLCAPIVYGEDTGEMKVEVAFCFDTASLVDGANVTAFSNFCPTREGTHIDGAIEGICRWFQKYMNSIYLGQKSKVQVKFDDIKQGLSIMISAAHLQPIFDGQSKEKLSNEEMKPFVKEVVMRGLDIWAKEKPSDLQKICGYLKQVAQLRQKADAGKAKIAKSYNASAITGLSPKYQKPTGTEHLEFWMIEGDSAGGTAQNARANDRQGILPLRGKIPNAFEKSEADILSNVECRSIIDIVGGGEPGKNYKKHFDISKVKWEKIIAAPDADVDGSHINALLLRLFLLYMPDVLKYGLYYKAVAPLYGMKQGKKYKYYIDRMDMLKYFQGRFIKENELLGPHKEKISQSKLSEILLEFADYTWDLELVANTYRVDPLLLEMTLQLYAEGKSAKAIAKEARKIDRFKYVNASSQKGVITVEGNVGNSYDTIFLNDKFLKESEPIMKYIKNATSMHYILNGEKVSMYTIMSKFDNLTRDISRFKGLGEMQEDQFRDSVMSPTGDRTLIQYTIDDAMEEIETVRAYESDKSKILDHIESVSRIDLAD